MPRLVTCLMLLALAAVPAYAQVAPTPAPVWVNPKSGIYHCPGTEHYGTTSDGEYMAESAAIAKGYSPNGGRRCSEGARRRR